MLKRGLLFRKRHLESSKMELLCYITLLKEQTENMQHMFKKLHCMLYFLVTEEWGSFFLCPSFDYDCSPFNLKGYLQKVSRNTGRSRWRNPKRGTKLVRLTVEIRKHRIYRSSVWSTQHFMNLKYELRKHPGSSWLLPRPCPESAQHLQNTVNTNYLLITVNAVAYYKF